MNSMVPTDIFFKDVEKVLDTFADDNRTLARTMIETLDRTAQELPRVAEQCHTYQAKLYLKLKDFEAALVAIAQALEYAPNNPNLITLRGDIHRKAQDYQQALQDYSFAVELHPEAVTARLHRAEIRQTLGEPQTALDDINDALRLEPRDLRLLYRRGLIFVDLRRLGDALQDFRTVARLTPNPDLKRKAEERLRELGEQ